VAGFERGVRPIGLWSMLTTCKGDGLIKVEMHFLADIYVSCDVCDGRRYNRETLEVFKPLIDS
jgi:hypothetical protein